MKNNVIVYDSRWSHCCHFPNEVVTISFFSLKGSLTSCEALNSASVRPLKWSNPKTPLYKPSFKDSVLSSLNNRKDYNLVIHGLSSSSSLFYSFCYSSQCGFFLLAEEEEHFCASGCVWLWQLAYAMVMIRQLR